MAGLVMSRWSPEASRGVQIYGRHEFGCPMSPVLETWDSRGARTYLPFTRRVYSVQADSISTGPGSPVR